MANPLEKNIENGLKVIEDLKLLAAHSERPIVDQLHYYLTEIKTCFQTKDFHLSSVKEKLCSMIENKLRESPVPYTFECDSASMKLEQLDKLYDILPSIMELVKSLFRRKELKVKCESGIAYFYCESKIQDQELIRYKNEFQKLSKMMVKKKILMVKSNHFAEFEMAFDLRQTEDKFFVLNFLNDENKKLDIYTTVLVSFYRLNIDTLESLSEHTCLELKNDGTVISHSEIPAYFRQEFYWQSRNFDIIHFPFFFRPVSMIIPSTGELIDSPIGETKWIDEVSGRINQSSGQESRICKLDFFSLFE